MPDFADDARRWSDWLADRKDVDPKRIAVVGHSEGAWVGAAGRVAGPKNRRRCRDRRAVNAGAELVLEQQRRSLDRRNAPADRAKSVGVQKQISRRC